jgi:hypothetical protein
MQLVLRARQLNQRDGIPVVVDKTKKGKVIYVTGNKIAELLRKAIKKVRPDTTPDKLKQYSTHSLRVWACILLNKAGKLPDYIKRRLCHRSLGVPGKERRRRTNKRSVVCK